MNAVGTEWVTPGLPRIHAVGTEWVTPGLPRIHAVGTEWVTPGLPRMIVYMYMLLFEPSSDKLCTKPRLRSMPRMTIVFVVHQKERSFFVPNSVATQASLGHRGRKAKLLVF